MKMTVDLHMHTNYSDGVVPLPKLIDFCGQAGLDAIAVTDHVCSTDSVLGMSAKILKFTLSKANWKEYFCELEKQRNRAWREYQMIVYTGIEFTRNTFSHPRNAHILAVDVKDYINPNQTEEEWLLEAREQGALTVAAHPLKLPDASSQTYFLYDRREHFSKYIDVWEVANARTFWNDMMKTPFALSAASDLHSLKKWPSWRTVIDCEKDPEAIKQFMKNSSNPRWFNFVTGRKEEFTHSIFRQGALA